jgi:BON domain
MSRIIHPTDTSSPRFAAPASTSRLLIAALGLALTFSAAGCKSTPAAPATDDATLSTALHSRISGDSALSAEPIQTSVQNGVATLNGTVSSEAARSLAASDAAQVTGIRTVVNNLSVQPAQTAAAPPAPEVKPAPEPVRPAEKEKKPTPAKKQVARYDAPIAAPVERSAPAPIQETPAPVAQAAPAPPPPPAFRSVTIASGSTIPVRITQTLDSATTQQGENFSGVVATDVIIDGLVAIPQGTPVTGRVDEVHEAAHFKGSSLLTVELTSINRKGEKIPVTTEPFSKEGAGRGKNTAEKVGGGAAVGAILGGIFGGGKGAAIGAASGGALGAGANTVTRGQQVQIPSETLIRFRLTNAIAVKASTRDAADRSASSDSQRRPLDPQ